MPKFWGQCQCKCLVQVVVVAEAALRLAATRFTFRCALRRLSTFQSAPSTAQSGHVPSCSCQQARGLQTQSATWHVRKCHAMLTTSWKCLENGQSMSKLYRFHSVQLIFLQPSWKIRESASHLPGCLSATISQLLEDGSLLVGCLKTSHWRERLQSEVRWGMGKQLHRQS